MSESFKLMFGWSAAQILAEIGLQVFQSNVSICKGFTILKFIQTFEFFKMFLKGS